MKIKAPVTTGKSWKAGIVLLLGLLASSAVTWRLRETIQLRDAERFHNNVANTQDAIADRLEMYVSLLRSAAAHLAASEELTKAKFQAYTDRLQVTTAYPGIQGIGFSKRVLPGELDDLIESARATNTADFRVWPERARAEYHTILYLEPLDRRNRAAIGYDMFTEPTRQAAMAKARDTGLPAASGKVTLVQEIDERKQAGFLIYVPVYRGGTVPAEIAERREKLAGFIYSPFRADDLLAGVFASKEKPRLDFTVYDGSEAQPEAQLHQSGSTRDPRFTATETIEVAGRPWTLAFATRPEFDAASGQDFLPVVFMTGLLLSLLIAGITWSEARARSVAEGNAVALAQSQRELDAQKQWAEVTLSSIGDAVLVADEMGQITFINPVAEQLCGWTAASATGMPLSEVFRVVDADSRVRAESPVSKVLREGGVVGVANHSVLIASDGREWPIDDSAAPIRNAQGAIRGVVLVFRDVTEREATARAVRESEERFRVMADSAPVMIWVTDREGSCTYLSQQWYRFTGLRPGAGLGTEWLDRVHPDDRDSTEAAFRRATDRRATFERDFRLLRHDGVYRWVANAAAPREAADGSFLGYTGSLTDIDDRKLAEDEVARLNRDLHARLAEFETLLAVIPVGIGIALDAQCQQIRTNPAFAAVLGLKPEENASKTARPGERPTHFRCVSTEGREIPDDQLPMQVAAREGREVRDVEFDIVHSDGRVVRLLEYAAPLFDERGKPRGCVGAFIDISERRKAEARQNFLLRLDDAVRPLSDPAEITAVSARLLGEHLGADRCAYADVEDDEDTFNLTGDYTRGVPSIVGRYTFGQFGEGVLSLMRENRPYVVSDIKTDPRRPADLTAYQQTMICAVVCVPLHKSGRLVAAMAVHQKTPRPWSDDEVELVLSVANRCWESIERVRVARNLRQSEETFRQLANSIPQLAWMARPDGGIFWYNDRWREYIGKDAESLLDWGWQGVHDPAEFPRVLDSWKTALAAGTSWEDVFPLRRHDGEFRWHLSRALPLKDDQGRVVLWFGTNTDVTDQRRLLEEREQLLQSEREARAAAERAGRMKDEFLATLSHELRTPLNAILGFATLLRMGKPDDSELDVATAAIERNARLQAKLIEDLLEMHRIVSGKVRLDLKRLPPAEVLEETFTSALPEAEEKGIELQKSIGAPTAPVLCDPVRLHQVVWNLLSNAIKFTPAGGLIRLSLEQSEDHVTISVVDNGQGISADFLPHVFDRFRQADGSTTRLHGGLGLGLSIVRQLVELHAGTVRAESAGDGRGAAFHVTLPIASAASSLMEGADAEAPEAWRAGSREKVDLDGVQVLVVDDEPDATAMIQRLLEQFNARVEQASSAREAWDLLEVKDFDVLLSDISMPHEDGYQFIRRLRASGARHHGIPAAALTAFARDEDKARASEAGFQAHLSKPIETNSLVKLVASLAGRDRPQR